MTPKLNTIHQGDVLDVLRSWPDGFVQCVVTSPPYWGLRDYGLPPSVWGGDEECKHEWSLSVTDHGSNRNGMSTGTASHPGVNNPAIGEASGFCRCGAWRGTLGLEPTPELYIENMVAVFREVRRILRDDGTCWVNMGDSYAGGGNNSGNTGEISEKQKSNRGNRYVKKPVPLGLKPKDLCGMPWRLALALQADGWWLRSDIIWHKPNPMPESVTDRPTKSHEYIFLLTKQAKYYYDAHAIWEPSVTNDPRRPYTSEGAWELDGRPESNRHGGEPRNGNDFSGRNKRSVWTVATQPYKFAHFACFPEKLIEPCILAGTSERGCCAECGKPWERVVSDAIGGAVGRSWHDHEADEKIGQRAENAAKGGNGYERGKTTGWRAACSCEADTRPCIILDPFMGAGTTAVVAKTHKRSWLGIELNPEYVEMARKRINNTQERLF